MSDKNLRKEDSRSIFRPDPTLIYRHGIPDHLKEPGYIYKRVIYKTPEGFYKGDPYHVQTHLDKGWEFVYETGAVIKSKANAAEEKDNLRPDPINFTSPDGTVSFYLRITTKRFHDNKAAMKTKRQKILQASVTKSKPSHEQDKEVLDLNEMIKNP